MSKRPLDEEMPAGLEDKIVRRAAPLLHERRKQRVPRGWLGLVLAGAVAALVAVVILREPRRDAPPPGAVSLASAPDFELLERLDLLRDMEMLRSGDLIERVKEKRWAKPPKKKT